MSRTVLGPLTSVFTAPPKCATPYVNSASDGIAIAYGLTCSDEFISFDNQCYPTGISSWYYGQFASPTLLAAHSPASQCPSGWTSACAVSKTGTERTYTNTADANIFSQILLGETAIGCCLRGGWECDTDYYQQCTYRMTSNEVISGTAYTTDCSVVSTTVTATLAQSTPQGVIWRIVLIDGTPSSTDTTGPTSTTSGGGGGTGIVLPGGGGGDVDTSGGSSGGLSTGAKAGIGVGVALGVILLAALAFFLIRRNKKNKADTAPAAAAAAAAAPTNQPSNGPAPTGAPVMAQTGAGYPQQPPPQDKPQFDANGAQLYLGLNGYYGQDGKQDYNPNMGPYAAQYGQQPPAPTSPTASYASPAPTYGTWGNQAEVRHEMDSTTLGSGSGGNTNSVLGGGLGGSTTAGQSISAASVSGAPTSPGGAGHSASPNGDRLFELDASQAAHVR